MSRGVYEGATNEAQKALVEVQEKSRPAIRTAMAAVMIKQRKYEQARVQLTTAIKENDSYLNAWMRLIDLMQKFWRKRERRKTEDRPFETRS